MASSVMGRPEDGRMHQLAVRAAPKAITNLEEHLTKDKSRVVAIERHDCDWREGSKLNEERFLWIKARDKITIEQVKNSYRSHYNHTDIQLTLRVDGRIPEDSATLGDLDNYNDQYVVFTTQTSSDTAEVAFFATSPPLAPQANQTAYTSQSESLLDLPPTTTDQAIFMRQDGEGDTLDPDNNVNVDHSNADSMMDEQNSRVMTGTPATKTIRRASDMVSEQASLPDRTLSTTPVRMVDPQTSSSEYIPRKVRNAFGAGDTAESQTTSSQPSLQRLLQDSSPERLEAAVSRGITVLSDIEEPLNSMSRDVDAQKWIGQIEAVRDLAKKNRTVIGVVGNTGAGKSSVINAVLEEERLVPTNCMRACTAVVTELSYNESTNESARYRAEIEFIQLEDWRRELKVLFEEVFDNANGMSKDVHVADSIAGVAYAKIRAVYHKHTKDMLQKSTIDQLMSVPSISTVLGTVKRINSRDCASFYQRLQYYVDSQQKPNSNKKSGQPKRELQLWPLIKVVRIYTKADALSTGAVIVDLPGVHDSNAARAAVAEGYIKECTGLWVVAPITRAVDDKAAKNLLGNTFKRQLKYDGSYSAVTFICSKTDDISRTEAAEALQLGEIMAEQEAERDAIDQKMQELKDERRKAQVERKKQDDEYDQHENEFETWEEEMSKLEQSEDVNASVSLTKKRRHVPDRDFAGAPGDQSLTPQQIRSEIDKHRRLKRAARQRGQELRDHITSLQLEVNNLEDRKAQIDKDSEALCIQGRNKWSRERIREDFAEGIKELDQENAVEENLDDFDPDEDIRDYDEVARSLPVFCVSSRAYQKLSGRLEKDGDVNGFTSLSQTEIPQLQAHCRKLTEAGRHDGCKGFLNNLSRLLTSLTLWASDDGNSQESSSQQRKSVAAFVTKNLQRLEQSLQAAIDQTMEDVEQTLNTELRRKFASAAQTAAKKAVPTSDGWGATRDAGGLFWATYKATVRRHGVFQGASGSRNFNHDLTEPLTQGLASCWEKAFKRRLPDIFNGFPKTANAVIQDFHDAVEEKCIDHSLGVSRVARLKDNTVVLEGAFNDLAKQTIGNVAEAQREINREFTPAIAVAMGTAYSSCIQENGRGSFARMKNIMHEQVSAKQATMFGNATLGIWNQLDTMCKQCRTTLRGRVQRIYQSMAADYQSIVSTDASKDRTTGQPERVARRKVDDVISQSEEVFAEVLNCDLEQLKAAGMMEVHGQKADTGSEEGVEDAAEPLIELSSDGADEDVGADF